MPKKVVVIGAGPMGLAAAYHAAKAGHQVDLLEASDRPGGMAAHFDFGGLSIERFYHFVCKADKDTFALMDEIGIGDKMRWRPTKMGYFIGGKVHPWGDPISLLRFPHLTLAEKVRYGLHAFTSSRRKNWSNLDKLSSRQWIEAWCGKRVYDKMWRRLFDLKFYEYADNISAAWTWTRIKRVATSRRSLFQEELGHIEGGSQTLVDALAAAVAQAGGKLRYRAKVSRILIENGRVTGVETPEGRIAADAVISTVPTPFVAPMAPDLPADVLKRIAGIENVGVVCVLFKLKRSLTPNFWLNISDAEIDIPGLVEFSNLREVGATIVYVPFYMPITNPKFGRSDEAFVTESFGYLRRIKPELSEADILGTHVGRLRHAQPVCTPNFLDRLPPVQTGIAGLQIADTCYYYPEDRGISESVRFGKMMAEAIEGSAA
jgi:protoporphyrinogen oxidase